MDEALSLLQSRKEHWVAVGAAERVTLLEDVQRDFSAVAERWVAAGVMAKSIEGNALGEAEEWLFFAAIARAIRILRQSLSAIARHGRPAIPGPVTRALSGQVVTRVFPHRLWERVLFRGITGEVWMEPGVSEQEVTRAQASAYRDTRRQGKLALVLGAGNASMLPVIDVLHKLFVENQVVLLKPNPVNAYLGPLIEEGLGALVRRGFLRVVYGGAEEGAYLCEHPAVEEIHLTGSASTFEAIVFGRGAEGERRKAAREPLLDKRFTCELGNVSPVIVVPGPWSERDLQDQAEQIVTWLVANAGFGCLTPRVIIQHREWPLRDRLVEAISEVLAAVPTRRAYYPGARDLYREFLDAHPEARQFGVMDAAHLPWAFITDVDPARRNDICFTREAFCGMVAETALEAEDVPGFLELAVTFANSTLWGNLNAVLLVHPSSTRDPEVAAALERAIARLRYGTVLVNMAAFAAYYFGVMPWGGYPGNQIDDIQSGTGKTANFLMLEGAEKSVVRAPFMKRFDVVRVTFPARPRGFARALARFEGAPAPWRMAAVAARALWG
jgi:hypothetical protein